MSQVTDCEDPEQLDCILLEKIRLDQLKNILIKQSNYTRLCLLILYLSIFAPIAVSDIGVMMP